MQIWCPIRARTFICSCLTLHLRRLTCVADWWLAIFVRYIFIRNYFGHASLSLDGCIHSVILNKHKNCVRICWVKPSALRNSRSPRHFGHLTNQKKADLNIQQFIESFFFPGDLGNNFFEKRNELSEEKEERRQTTRSTARFENGVDDFVYTFEFFFLFCVYVRPSVQADGTEKKKTKSIN